MGYPAASSQESFTMADPILALITPLTPGGGHVAHPIAPGGPPGGVDPGYGVEGPVDPGYGIPAPPLGWRPPGRPGHLPAPPVGLWPPPGSPTHPIVIPEPDSPSPEHPIVPPVGEVWPPLNLPDYSGKALLLVWVPGMGFHWVVVDTSLAPTHPIASPGTPAHPIATPPEASPKTK